MQELILIKLGGSIITDKTKAFTPNTEVINRLGKEIKAAKKDLKANIILTHGSGSFGHSVAAKYQTKEGMINQNSFKGFPLVADAAAKINRIVVSSLLTHHLPAVAFSPLSLIFASGQKTKGVFLDSLEEALRLKFLPVLYGDVIMDHKQGFCVFSAEKIIATLVAKLKGKYSKIRIIFCGDTNGVYDAEGITLPTITAKSFPKLSRYITGSAKTDVTGGMLHKVSESLILAKAGIETTIVNGNLPHELTKAMLGKKTRGTTITSQPTRSIPLR